MIFNFLQLAGGFILAFGNIPQILQIIRTKSAVDLNLHTFLMMFVGIAMMQVYAINLVINGAGWAFLVTNTLSMLASGTMVVLILKYGNKRKSQEEK